VGGEGREEGSKTFCRLRALIQRGLGSGMSGSLEEEGVSCLSESETRARFRVGKHNLGERRGEVGGLGVVRRWTAICCNEIGEYTRMIPKKLHTIQVKIRKRQESFASHAILQTTCTKRGCASFVYTQAVTKIILTGYLQYI
jgi:hypothetical protein